MNKTFLATLLITISASLTAPVYADQPSRKHQRHQVERIGQGVKSGELTKNETKDLMQDQREIRKERRQYKSDGKFSKNERQEVRQDQVAASKEIREEKHDEQERPKAE